MIKAEYISKSVLAKDTYSFKFRSADKVRYTAGQFIELYIPHENADDRGIKRWFTLSSSPTEEDLTITTKILPNNSSTFKTALNSLELGTIISMASPMGDFVLPKDTSIPLTFVAGGIGCTPFRSILKYLQDTSEIRDIGMIYAVRDQTSAAFLNLFERLDDRFQLLDTSKKEFLDGPRILGFSNVESGYYYISGPENMVEELESSLLSHGIEKNRLHGDFFPNYSKI